MSLGKKKILSQGGFTDTTNTLDIFGDSSCIAAYTFNNTLDDLGGNHDLTLTSNASSSSYVTSQYAHLGQAFQLKTSSDNGSAGVPDGNDFLSYRGQSFLLKVLSRDDDDDAIFTYNIKRQGYSGPLINVEPPITAGGVVLGSNDLAPLNTWTHIVITITGSTVYLYHNGVLQDSTSVSNGAVLQGSGIGMSDAASGGRFQVDQLRIFNRYLDTDDVAILYNEALGV